MSVATLHVLHGLNVAGTFLGQISSSQASPQINLLVREAAGVPQPLFVSNAGQKPIVTFESSQLKTILDLTGIGMYDASSGNVDLFYRKAKNLSAREAAASTVHQRLRMANAGLIVNRITAGHDREASASCVVCNPYDGSNEPIVHAGSVALGGTSAYTQSYRAGPVFLNGVQVNGVEDITIDFGQVLIEKGSGGELYITFCGIRNTRPVVTIRTADLKWSDVGLNGLAISSLSGYFRKLTANGAGPVSAGSAAHIKFAGTAGLATIDDTSSGDNNDAMTSLRCTMVAPSESGNALSLNTAIAITT